MKKTCFLVIICLLFLMISCKEINTDPDHKNKVDQEDSTLKIKHCLCSFLSSDVNTIAQQKLERNRE